MQMPKSKTAKGVSSSAIQDIPAAHLNFMTMDKIKAEIRSIANMHKYFVFSNFEILKRSNPLTGDVAGYQGQMLPLQYFIMHTELSEKMVSGKQSKNFQVLLVFYKIQQRE